MKNPPFNYHRPATVDEALALLATYGDEAKVLAGGQSLLPIMALRLGRPEHVVDIGTIADLKQTNTADGVTFGAMVRHAEAEKSPEVARHAPLVAAALPHVGHRAIRNRGTVVGSIAHADPAAELPAVCLAAGATMTIASSRGTREVQADDFFEGYFSTAIEPHELLTQVHFPRWSETAGGSVVEISRRHGDYAMVGLACVADVQNGAIARAALSFFGVSSKPVRVTEAEEALVGKPPTEEAFAEAAAIVGRVLEPGGDIHATTQYRRHIAQVLTSRGLTEATSRIGELT